MADTGKKTLSGNQIALLRQASTCYIVTLMADGSPQVTQTWVDTDGTNVVVNTVQRHVKVRNIARDPRVAVAIADRANPSRYFQVRGRVVEVSTDGAAEHIEELSMRYRGTAYDWSQLGDDQVRVRVVIAPEHISGMQ